ncbi:hypothetical protein D1610_03040 [Sphingomonas gilva]|uniref:Uncharacterized protein n=1 Tax=Sphingomonas gilva TaxID=2305907 RepID=A0A396RR31_9SPHN|nr:DUF6491 family protein [Sphingomonas gilva]RHW19107.1 hypothetical protein D1610_03040 [Sphingomonas gilva]
MRTALILAPALALLAAACTTSPERQAEYAASQAAKVPAATPAGEPVDCLQTNRIRNSNVHNDSVIDFETTDGHIYRNTLPQSCPGLGFERRFAYKTTIGQLCSVDTITVLQSGVRGPTCGLGTFQPVELAE